MTTKPSRYSNKITGYGIEPISSEVLKELPEELQLVSREWLEARHAADTGLIDELKAKLQASETRGDDFIYKMLAAERKQIQAEALAANRLTEINKLDAELAKYVKMEDYLFQTMQVAQDQRQKYLDGLEVE